MACGATLKRHHEFDPHLGIPSGCSPKRIKISYEEMMATDAYQPSQNFVEATQRLAHDSVVSRTLPSSSHSILQTHSSTHSPVTWKNIVSPSSSPKSIQTQSKITQPKGEPMVSTSTASYVCDQLVKEHEMKLREHYEKVLVGKLAEKYESYIKFNHDLLKNRFGQSSASYVS